jgi:hypothetical protein
VLVEWMNDRQQADDPDYRGMHTFALLVSPEQIDITYRSGRAQAHTKWAAMIVNT